MTPPESSRPAVPERINGLAAIAANLAWSWNRNARALFRLLDAALWRRTQHNPIELLRRVDPARLAVCAADPAFLRLYDAVVAAAAQDATSAGTWFATSYPQSVTRSIAYFCAEFGLHASVPIYSGGLGVLAGDQCKAASDLGVPLVGVGLFYTRGYSDQRLRLDGWQEDAEERFDVAATPLERVRGPKGDPCLATVRLSGRPVSVGAWRVMVGRVPILLLDTDLEQNDAADRGLSHRLYAGGPDLRLRQEWILGVGGVRVLRTLGYDPAAWHANEGHAAFMLVERVRELVTRGLPFADAVRRVRGTSVFTTHTPVPAGHDTGFWDKVLELDGGAVWAVHSQLKSHLMRSIREQARRRWADQWKEALHLVGAGTLLDPEALTIGFGRRFATYKRADLIFRDPDRLQRLLVNPWRPVQIVFSGKAHPGDEPGKQVLQRVYAHTREARFEGRIAFIEDYDMHLAHSLVQGVDLWLNVPRPPLEACGTSGMKAALNGVPQLSTLDGWWAEGYDGPNGWGIPPAPAGQDADAADAEQLYRLLEAEVVPLFYDRDAANVPRRWVETMKHALRAAGARFTAQRMVREYLTQYYLPAMRGEPPADDPPTA